MPVKCSTCGKAGWRGCGAHVEQVLAGVPQDQRCRCAEERKQASGAASGGFWDRLLGKR